jgi:hypothetical protein
MTKTNEEAIAALIDDLKQTPHGVGLALLRERLLALSDITKVSIEKHPKAWENPLYSTGMYLDLCRRIDRHLGFNSNEN